MKNAHTYVIIYKNMIEEDYNGKINCNNKISFSSLKISKENTIDEDDIIISIFIQYLVLLIGIS